jgi:hypothetical protein
MQFGILTFWYTEHHCHDTWLKMELLTLTTLQFRCLYCFKEPYFGFNKLALKPQYAWTCILDLTSESFISNITLDDIILEHFQISNFFVVRVSVGTSITNCSHFIEIWFAYMWKPVISYYVYLIFYYFRFLCVFLSFSNFISFQFGFTWVVLSPGLTMFCSANEGVVQGNKKWWNEFGPVFKK